MKNSSFYILSTIIVLSLALWAIQLSDFEPVTYRAEHGSLVVTPFNKNDLYLLEGEWLYTPGALREDFLLNKTLNQAEAVSMPHLWPAIDHFDGRAYGYATYQLNLSGLDPLENYAMLIRDASSAYRVVVNVKTAFLNGTVGRTAETHSAFMKTDQGVFHSDAQGKAEIIVEVSNFNNARGGMWTSPYFGSVSSIFFMSMREKLIEAYLYSTMFMMGLFFLALYAFSREEKSMLFLGLFSILSALRITLMGHRQIYGMIPGLTWAVQSRIEHLAGYLLLPLFGYLTCSLDFVKPKKFMIYAFHILVIFSLIICLIMPKPIYDSYFTLYKYLIFVFLGYFILIAFQGIRKKADGAMLIFIAYVSMALGAFLEIYVAEEPFNSSFSTLIMVSLFAEVIIVKFISLKRTKEELETTIITDKLTGAYNRFHLEQLSNAKRFEPLYPGDCHIFFIDINKFKFFNDTYGHETGDEILKAVASRLKASLRATDKVFRYGGDEFVILAFHLDEHKANELIDRLHNQFDTPVQILNQSFNIKLSVGISTYSGSEDSLRDAIYRSDEHMYHLRRTGVYA